MKRKLVVTFILLLFIFPLVLSQNIGQTTSVSSNTFISSNIQVSNPSINIHYQEIQFNEYQNICEDRKDFIIQVAPGGCTPNVVRSDLLAEQNVPVFCQLQAIQVNPTIDVSRIRNIRLVPVGERPEGIVGIGFQRANAALSFTRSRIGDRSTGFATVENIGYAVIVLKQQPNEDLQLDEIIGKLSARIEYDVPRGFGLGLQDKALSVLTEDEWQQDFQQYGFFEGKAFVRLESVETEGISVGIYADANRKINSVRIPRGKTSREMYVPGFTCDAAFSITYSGSELPKPKALLEIGNDQYDAFEGNRFAEGFNCIVRNIIANDYGAGTVNIQCNGQPISLTLKKNGVILNFDDADPKIYHLGDILPDGRYLVYFDTTKDGKEFIITYNEDKLPDKLKKIAKSWESKNRKDIVEGKISVRTGDMVAIATFRDDGEGNRFIVDGDLEEEIDSSFNELVESFQSINADYKGIEIDDRLKFTLSSKETYAEAALFKAVELAISLGKQSTCVELRNELTAEYGENSALGLDCYQSFDTSKAVGSFTIDGQSYSIRLLGIDVPDKDDKKFIFSIDNNNYIANDEGEAFYNIEGNIMILKRITESALTVEGSCKDKEKKQSDTIQEGKSSLICGKTVFVSSIHLKKLAKIKLNPINHNVGSEVEFEYGIGIEQRAIKLNPEKSLEKIKRLDEDIEKWNNVNDNLEGAVEGLKAACFATSAALQVKNLFGNLGGKAAARQEVMTVWHGRCDAALANGGTDLIKGDDGKAKTYGSKDDCFNQNSKEIESQVEDVLKVSEGVNAVIKKGEEGHIKKAGLLQGKTVSPEAGVGFTDKILPEEYGSFSDLFIGEDGNELRVMDVIGEKDGVKLSDSASYKQSIELYEGLKQYENAKANGNEQLEKMYQDDVYSILNNINEGQKLNELQANAKDIVKTLGLTGSGDLGIASYEKEGKFIGTYKEFSLKETKNVDGGAVIPAGSFIWRVTYGDKDNSKKTYYVTLGDESEFNGNVGRPIDQVYNSKLDNTIGAAIRDEELINKIKAKYNYLIKIDAGTYSTQYDKPEVIYHETAPLKGKAAVVPINTKKGWYAGTRNTLSSLGGGYQSPVQDSGLPQVFWLCNVGSDNKQQFFSTDFGNDHCERFTLNAGQAPHFDGISTTEVRSLVKEAECALREAAREWKQGVKTVSGSSCLGRNIPVGNPAPSLPGTSCADFMSPKECQLMFNVCDPVICPNSRCNLGGNYYVDNVVNTGIVGSALLCLPNAQEGIAIPVCLTGINAGIEAYTSVLEAHRDCLQEHVDTGRYVGICDEVTAVRQCEFFWNQVAPLSSTLLPNLLGKAKGGDVPRGGGEYLNVAGAWENMRNSMNFFKDRYAVNALQSYRQRSVQEVGTDVCKGFVSSSFPSDFKSLIEADSPSQFTGWFDEIPMSSAVVPAQSHYKVFYHIFAGDDQGVYFSVYLKNAPGTSFFQDSGVQMVDTGFIPRGEYADEARDLTSVSGFKELCIRINNQDKCGFQKVSTNFAINFARDKFIENQLTEQNIASEKACISGTPSFSGLLNPNLQSGIQDAAIDPQIYQSGIIRVCATGDPGSQTSPGQWTDVGHCGDQRIRCWLDTDSIDRALSVGNNITRQTTISELGLMADKLEDDQNVVKEYLVELINWYKKLVTGNKGLQTNELITNPPPEKTQEPILDSQKVVEVIIEDDIKKRILEFKQNVELEKLGALPTIPVETVGEDVPEVVIPKVSNNKCDQYDSVIQAAVDEVNEERDFEEQLDWLLIKAIMIKESSCDWNADHTDGSIGLMGVEEGTFKDICVEEGGLGTADGLGIEGIQDIQQIDGGEEDKTTPHIQCAVSILVWKYEHNEIRLNLGSFDIPGGSDVCKDQKIIGKYKHESAWDRAVRGYNGWGCNPGNPEYVNQVNVHYDGLKTPSNVNVVEENRQYDNLIEDKVFGFEMAKSNFGDIFYLKDIDELDFAVEVIKSIDKEPRSFLVYVSPQEESERGNDYTNWNQIDCLSDFSLRYDKELSSKKLKAKFTTTLKVHCSLD